MKVLVAGSQSYRGRGAVWALRRHGWPVIGFDVWPLETLPADPDHVELTLSWLNRFRRLKVRFERRADIHQAFFTLGSALICWRQVQNRFC